MRAFKHSCYFLTSVLAGIAISGCEDNAETTQPQITSITESVYASAAVQPVDVYEASANTQGILAAVHVTEGDTVTAGQPLFIIENEATGLNEANARLAYELALKEYRGSASRLEELKLDIGKAREQLRLDSLDFIRQQALWDEGIGSRSALERKELAYRTSRSNYLAAVSRRARLETELENQLERARNNYAISRENRSDFTIDARIDGYVYSVYREAGEFVNPQQALALIGRKDTFILEMEVDERDIARVERGQRVLVSMDSYADAVFEAVVRHIRPIMDPRSQTFVVEAAFRNPPPRLYPNLSAETNIVVASRDSTLAIPRTYLMPDDKVLTGRGDTVSVVTGIRSLEFVEIVSGLTAGDIIKKPL